MGHHAAVEKAVQPVPPDMAAGPCRPVRPCGPARAQWRVTICPGLPGKSIQWKGAPRQSADCLGQQPHAASAARAQWRVMICPGLPGKSI